jgi:ATP-dependent Lhr-like helicase
VLQQALAPAERWFRQQGWQVFPFQRETWEHCIAGRSGMLNAPTGAGKTYAVFAGAALAAMQRDKSQPAGPRIIWITPIRALSRDIAAACEAFLQGIGSDWSVAIRTGDTAASERERQRRRPPQVLITTPESLHLIMATKGYRKYFAQVAFVVADEWHELMGTKRAVLLELALSRMKSISSPCIWGISATIGNLHEALDVLMGSDPYLSNAVMVRAHIDKKLKVVPILPAEIERYPWAGHLGLKLAEALLPIIQASRTTLIFTNTRSQAEIWYQHLLELMPDLAGLMAMHHGSISRELRDWVEDALHEGKLRCVVCTSSLDLGVDFRPVETIIQVGSPKGVARFLQRAGRSGHQPGAESVIYFLPTHGLQLLECAALKRAIDRGDMESRHPYVASFDVLVQYLITLAVGEGFSPAEVLPEIKGTFSYRYMTDDEWTWALSFVTRGGPSLHAYDEFRKVEVQSDGVYSVVNRGIAMRHRLSIGAIVSDAMLAVKFQSGGTLGHIEEWFVSRLSPGDTFWFAGRPLELIRVKEMTVQVKLSKKKSGNIPSWMGGRMNLSAMLSENLRTIVAQAAAGERCQEIDAVQPILQTQRTVSHIPHENQLLVEKVKTRDGYHIYMYPFEGRYVHEGLSALLAYRLSKFEPRSFSIGLNDYGFELLCEDDLPIEEWLDSSLFSTDYLLEDLQSCLNHSELARRRFRDIAAIAGLVFKGFPGHYQKDKHLQSSSQLFFDVFRDYDSNNLLYRQAFQEIMEFQLEEYRLRQALVRMQGQQLLCAYPEKPSPFAFPILVDRLREKFSNEQLEEKIRRMTLDR